MQKNHQVVLTILALAQYIVVGLAVGAGLAAATAQKGPTL